MGLALPGSPQDFLKAQVFLAIFCYFSRFSRIKALTHNMNVLGILNLSPTFEIKALIPHTLKHAGENRAALAYGPLLSTSLPKYVLPGLAWWWNILSGSQVTRPCRPVPVFLGLLKCFSPHRS